MNEAERTMLERAIEVASSHTPARWSRAASHTSFTPLRVMLAVLERGWRFGLPNFYLPAVSSGRVLAELRRSWELPPSCGSCAPSLHLRETVAS